MGAKMSKIGGLSLAWCVCAALIERGGTGHGAVAKVYARNRTMTQMLSQRSFRAMGVITIAAVYFLILVGGVVRASGAGMGCPDWPKCFGRWVPPTDVSQLPDNYQEIYAHRGYADTEFNAFKTWTEYVNRLIGASIGLLIFATLLLSLSYWSVDRIVVASSFASFVLVGFNGWLGSVVVASNLVPVIVTLHMVAALLVVGALIYAVARSNRLAGAIDTVRSSATIPWLIGLVLLLSLVQLVLGTQVREQVDHIARVLGEGRREHWAGEFGRAFLAHRSFSIVILLANSALAVCVARATSSGSSLRRSVYVLMGIIVAEIVVGALLYYAGMPAVLQPLHLLLSALLFGAQFYILIVYRMAQKAPAAAA